MQDGKACLLGMERVATWFVGRVAREMTHRWIGGTANYNESSEGTHRPGDFCILFAPHKEKLAAHGIESQNFGAGSRTDIMLPLRAAGYSNTDFVLWVYVTTDYAVGTYDAQEQWNRSSGSFRFFLDVQVENGNIKSGKIAYGELIIKVTRLLLQMWIVRDGALEVYAYLDKCSKKDNEDEEQAKRSYLSGELLFPAVARN